MIAQPRCGREVWKPQRRRLLRADCVDSYSLVFLPCDFFCLVLALSTSLRAKRSNPFFLYTVRWIASLRSQCRMTVGAPERLVNRRLLHRLAKSGLQKIEVAAFIGLLDVAGGKPTPAPPPNRPPRPPFRAAPFGLPPPPPPGVGWGACIHRDLFCAAGPRPPA